MARVTLKQIAEAVGVSAMSVSNAFNNPTRLSPELREKILAKATELGYAGPDPAARNLRSGKTNAYGVLFSEPLSYAFSDPYAVLFLAGISQGLEDSLSSVVLLSVPEGSEDRLEIIRRAAVDGFAGFCASRAAIELAGQRGLVTVTSDPRPDGDFVAIDDESAGREVGAHLRELGHRRVMIGADFFGSQREPAEYPVAEYVKALHQAGDNGNLHTWLRLKGILQGLGPDADVRFLSPGPNSRETGRTLAHMALDRPDRPTAIICVSDAMALGVMDGMADRDLIPGVDVSIAGFDDIPDAAHAGLTTIRQPILEKGRRAAELLLDPTLEPRQIMLEHHLMVRTSTGPVGRERSRPARRAD